METLGALVVFFAALFSVLNRFSLTPGLVGLSISFGLQVSHGPLTRYVKLRVAHAPGTFSPPPTSKEFASLRYRHARGTCLTHVPWCMSGSLTRGGGENVPGIPGAWTTRNFLYLVRNPWGRHDAFRITIPLWVKSTSDRWISFRKGQWFEALMFSSIGLNDLLNKHSSCRWFGTLCRSCDVTILHFYWDDYCINDQ